MNTYKMGEEIEVRCDEQHGWTKRIIVGMSLDGEAITKGHTDSACYFWKHHRKIKPPELVQWSLEDIKPGMQLRLKSWDKGAWAYPTAANDTFVKLDDKIVTYKDLLEYWETLDGKPCGKEPV